jgi:phosphatidylserine decarboxylase
MNTDNTFALSRTYKKGFKKVFEHEDRVSGNWRLKDGEVTMTVIGATNRENIGQVYSYRIMSINDSEMVYTDTMSGQRRVEWKLR